MADPTLDKSQPATPHRRQEARRQGHVARSSDLASAAQLLAGLAILLLLGQSVIQFFFGLTREQLGGEVWLESDRGLILGHGYAVLLELTKVVAPILGLLLAAGVLVHVLQTGFLWLPEKLAPDFDRINPLSGFNRMFSLAAAIRLAMGLLKLVVVSLVASWTLYERRDQILGVASLDLPQLASFIVDVLVWTTVKIALALLALAAADYLYQRFRHERDLAMTPQEVREETKGLQGDPQLAARRRQAHRQTALARISKKTVSR
jgi:flagellar biosynthesis protein FlhB